MRLIDINGRSARSRQPRLDSAFLPVVHVIGGAAVPPESTLESGIGAVVEPLEPKLHLTFTAGISASTSFLVGASYTLNLFTTAGTAKQWVVYWNDPADNNQPETFTDSSGFTNPYSVAHTYTTAGPSAPIKAVATSLTNLTATAYLGLDSSFGSTPTSSGKSLFTPSGASATSGVVDAVDINPSSTYFKDTYCATGYRTGTSHYQFCVTRTNPSGAVDSGWGNSGALIFSFDSGDDIPYAMVISKPPNGDGEYLVVGGKCATGWGLAIISTATATVDYQTPSNFQSGQVNALYYDGTDGDVSAAGNDGNGRMAAALLQPGFDGTLHKWVPNYQWSPIVKTYSVDDLTTVSATAVLGDVGNDDDSGNELEHVIILGGDTVYNNALSSDFTLLALNDSDGSRLTTFGSNGVIRLNTGCKLGAAYDSETSLVSWYGGGNYYITEVGNVASNTTLVRYLCSLINGNLTNASLDTSFGHNGVAAGPAGPSYAAVQDPFSGTIYTAGAAGNDFLIGAIDDTGNAATSFGNAGSLVIDLGSSGGNSTDSGYGIVFDYDGTLKVSGTSNSSYGDIGIIDVLTSNQP